MQIVLFVFNFYQFTQFFSKSKIKKMNIALVDDVFSIRPTTIYENKG